MFDHKKFSKDFKILKLYYLEQGEGDAQLIGTHIRALASMDLTTLQTDLEKTVFWINVYNGLTNYWIIEKEMKKSVLEYPFLTTFAKINIGGHRFSLDDIEHGILRNNRRSLYKIFRQFSNRDPRINLKVSKIDYRIHFALNCGAKSCPAVSFYSENNLEKQLRMAEENFIAQEFLVNQEAKIISCSKIFLLYKKDFENVYNNDPKYKGYKISYRKYDFSLVSEE
jgi:hypothetical protein